MNDATSPSLSPPPPPPDDQVLVESSHTYGRFLASHGRGGFVTDSKAANGGPGLAANAAELLLGSLGSCALGLVLRAAAERGLDLSRARVRGRSRRSAEDPTRYAFIELRFGLGGVSPAQAGELIAAFTSACPIYNTLLRGGADMQVRLDP